VGMTGFEPAASSSRTKRATGLRYIPRIIMRCTKIQIIGSFENTVYYFPEDFPATLALTNPCFSFTASYSLPFAPFNGLKKTNDQFTILVTYRDVCLVVHHQVPPIIFIILFHIIGVNQM